MEILTLLSKIPIIRIIPKRLRKESWLKKRYWRTQFHVFWARLYRIVKCFDWWVISTWYQHKPYLYSEEEQVWRKIISKEEREPVSFWYENTHANRYQFWIIWFNSCSLSQDTECFNWNPVGLSSKARCGWKIKCGLEFPWGKSKSLCQPAKTSLQWWLRNPLQYPGLIYWHIRNWQQYCVLSYYV